MKKLSAKVVAVASLALSLAGCKTYYITPQSLDDQLTAAWRGAHQHMQNHSMNSYGDNNLEHLVCKDASGKDHSIKVTNHTGIRITKKDGSRQTFYLNSMDIEMDTITGKKSNIMGIKVKPIAVKDVAKMEVQK